MTKQQYIRAKRKQVISGLILLLCSAIIIFMAVTSETDKDATAVLLTLPLSLYLIFTKEIVVYVQQKGK